MKPHTIVVGGGLAGLAAAAALADRGLKVTLLESRPRLGGRAASFVDTTTGEVIDNCQHVSMGCCTNLAGFCDDVDLSGFFRREECLNFVGPEGAIHRFATGWLPAPLHLLSGFGRLGYLKARDKWQIARALGALAREKPAAVGQPFAVWLRRHRQSPQAIERFWQVVLVSALSESLDRIDLRAARKVFVDAFLAHRHGWDVLIPTAPLDELYGRRLTNWLESRDVTIRLQAGVERLVCGQDKIVSAVLRSGETLEADYFVAAVPHYILPQLLPPPLQESPEVLRLSLLETAPISSVHFWFDREITPLPHAVLISRLSQWMFNRNALRQDDGDSDRSDGGHAYQVVISASRGVSQRPRTEIVEEVAEELRSVWPGARAAQIVHSRLVTEQKAVCSPLPGSDDCRPVQQSPIGNLQFAGDWTDTGWPSTMEGAVRSGYLAAENILAGEGRPQRLVKPDLPHAFLSRVLLRL